MNFTFKKYFMLGLKIAIIAIITYNIAEKTACNVEIAYNPTPSETAPDPKEPNTLVKSISGSQQLLGASIGKDMVYIGDEVSKKESIDDSKLPTPTESYKKLTSKEAQMYKYIKHYEDVAKTEMKKFGIPASIKMAQALIESGAGNSKLAKTHNNHFGIKCFSKRCTKGHCTNMTDDHHKDFFRVFDTAWYSWREHSKFLQKTRYKHLQEHGTDYKAWARGLQKAGYATDKNYANKLIRLIEDHNLHKLDQ